MSDLDVTQPAEEGDRGLPLFWGLLFLAVVTVIAVLLFRQIEFDAGAGVTEPTVSQTTLAEQPITTTTTVPEAGSIIEML